MIHINEKRILLTGGNGFLGRRIHQRLWEGGCKDVWIADSRRYDLRTEYGVRQIFQNVGPEIVIHAAAHAGGIGLNRAKPAELFYDNAIMGILMMEEARKAGVEKYVQIGTVCSYPKFTSVPFMEEDLWKGYPEETNAPYGLAKKMLLVQAQAYRQQYGFNAIYLMPVNMYGPGDHFDPQTSHVIPALVRKFVEAKKNNAPEVVLWGDGSASREFLYVDDGADAIVRATERYDGADPINIGVGEEITMGNLAKLIASLLDYQGEIAYDKSRPNGQPRRCLGVFNAFHYFGFKAQTRLKEGLQKTIDWYLKENS